MATTTTTQASREPVPSSGPIVDAGPAAVPPGRPGKLKRTLSRANFFRTVARVVASSPVLLVSLIRPTIARSLREKILLGVSAVNDCRYCQWGHSHWAMAHGVPLEEINQILGLQAQTLRAKDPAEAAAILFAQHYADHLDKCDPDSIAALREHYSKAQVAEILAYVRAITLGSLTGNTVDAFLGRFRRRPPSRSPPSTGLSRISHPESVPPSASSCDSSHGSHKSESHPVT